MTRSHRTARQAGTAFESDVVTYLAAALNNDGIERRAKTGARDRGDLAGVRTIHGNRVVVECKSTNRMELGVWVGEAEVERVNDGAAVGVVVHKRRGKGQASMGDQYVTMTLADLAVLLGGWRKVTA